jgi:hypothetical protein
MPGKYSRTHEYLISLRFREHLLLDPKVISSALRMRPDITWRKGDQKMSLAGAPMEGTRDRSYWSKTITPGRLWTRAEVGSDRIAERQVKKLLDRLAPHASLLRRIRKGGGSPEIWISSYSQRNYPFVIDLGISKNLTRLGVTLIIDVYPYKQRGCR